MKIGLAIAKRREELGITQDELAAKVGVSKSSISRWESGDISNMRRDRIQAIAKALDVSPLSLLQEELDDDLTAFQFHVVSERAEQMKKQNAPDDAIRSEIKSMVDNMSNDQAEKLRDLLKTMIQE